MAGGNSQKASPASKRLAKQGNELSCIARAKGARFALSQRNRGRSDGKCAIFLEQGQRPRGDFRRKIAAGATVGITAQGIQIMEKSYIGITKRISGDLRKLRQDIPDTMKAFSALAQAAGRDGAIDKKTKELIALAIGIATRCDGCIGFHIEALVRLGATRQEVEETLGMAVYMGGGPSLMYAADAIAAYEEFAKQMNVAA
jgi:AhpD family alkylhydroperoxidase